MRVRRTYRPSQNFPIVSRQSRRFRCSIPSTRCHWIIGRSYVGAAQQPSADRLEEFRSYLLLLARLGLDGRYQAKLDASDVVQQTMFEAHRDERQFRGQTTTQRAAWLRQILARNLANVRRDLGRAKRDTARERSLERRWKGLRKTWQTGWPQANRPPASKPKRVSARCIWQRP